MKNIIWILLITFLIGCSARPVKNMSFQGKPVYEGTPKEMTYTTLGRVGVHSSGFVWNSCESLANEGIDLAIQKSKNMGGDAMINLSISECTTRWGWFFLYILPGLGPWMTSVDIEGTAVQIQ